MNTMMADQPFEAIMEGNDYYARDAAEVVACMEKAAAELR